MINPHGWKDYRYRMLYTGRVHFIHANVTSTTTACPRRRPRREESPCHSAQPWLRTPDTRLQLGTPEARKGKGEGHGGGREMLVVHTPKQNKTKTNPKSMTKTVCVLSLESSQFPLVLSPVSRFSPTGPEGTVPSGEGRRMVVGDEDPRFPLLPLPTALLLTSYSGPSLRGCALVASASILLGGPVGGKERWGRARWLSISRSCQ